MPAKYSVIGLGKLGASMLAAIASRGFEVIGVDVSRHVVDCVKAGLAPVQETSLEEMMGAHRNRLRATMDHREAVMDSEVTFVVVPTPSDARGAFSLQYAAWAFREIGRALAHKDGYHLVVLTSTVLPGATRHGLLPILERESGKACGRDFGVCYSPEFIALGSIIHDFLNPDFNLIGEYDERSGRLLEACYAEIMENRPACRRMSIENAELTKVAVNTYVTTKITFANMLAELCEHIPGGDIDVVTDALGCDQRVGRRYLTGALGYGGPCFPRDNVALSFLAKALGTRADLADTTDRFNRSLPQRILDRLQGVLSASETVAVLGLAYKPFSHVVEESQGIGLAKALSQKGVRVVAYDPLAGDSAQAELQEQVVVLDSLEECLAQADTILITTPDPVFQDLTLDSFVRANTKVVIDFWRILEHKLRGQTQIHYIPIGCSIDDEANMKALQQLWRGATSLEKQPEHTDFA